MSTTRKLQFSRVTHGGRTALIREEGQTAIVEALLHGTGCETVHKGGRGALLRFPWEHGAALIRRYRRGGFIRHCVQDAYLLVNRPRRELEILAHLFERGIAVPEPLGACWERHGLLLRGALATVEVPNAVTLPEYLASGPSEMESVLRNTGRLIRSVHDLGVYHADLQAANILVSPQGLFILDFDNARLRSRLSSLQKARNLLRFRRSLEKNHAPAQVFSLMREGYGPANLPKWLDRLYRFKGAVSDWLSGRTARKAFPS